MKNKVLQIKCPSCKIKLSFYEVKGKKCYDCGTYWNEYGDIREKSLMKAMFKNDNETSSDQKNRP